jgi:hypothetical protein
MALISAKTESELRDLQGAKMEESPGTATSDSSVFHEFIPHFFIQNKVRQQVQVWEENEVYVWQGK